MTMKREIGGVVLAGGRASRMDYRDKALQRLGGKPLLAHVIEHAEPQVEQLLLSVNHNAQLYESFRLPIVPDSDRSYHGPLLGIYSAMRWYRDRPESEIKYLACFAADVPVFPLTVIDELARALGDSDKRAAYVIHRGQIQPLFSLWHLSLMETIGAAIEAGLYGPKLIFESVDATGVSCDSSEPMDFFNINSSDELEAAAQAMS